MLATSRARIVEPKTFFRGDKLAEEGVMALAASHIRKTLSIAAVMAQQRWKKSKPFLGSLISGKILSAR